MEFGVVKMDAGDILHFDYAQEVVYDLLCGKVSFEWDKNSEVVERRDCFHEGAVLLHVPQNTTVVITTLNNAEIAVARTENKRSFASRLLRPEDCLSANEERGACPLSEIFSEQALSLILPCWKAAVDSGEKDGWKKYKAEFLRASNYAGIAFGHAGCAAVHALSYPLGGVHHIAHGESNQVMFVPVMKKYLKKQPTGKINRLEALLAKLLGCDEKLSIQELYALMDRVLERKPMRAYGVTEEELLKYADSVIETQHRLLGNNYVPLTCDEILAIYESAF